jgi:hypothetical protein
VECLAGTAVATRASAQAADHPASAAVVGVVAVAEEDLVVEVVEVLVAVVVVEVDGGRNLISELVKVSSVGLKFACSQISCSHEPTRSEMKCFWFLNNTKSEIPIPKSNSALREQQS